MVRNMTCFYGEELENHPFSAVLDCLFNIFAVAIHLGGRSSIRNLRTRHAMVTGTRLSWQSDNLLFLHPVQRCTSYGL